MKKRFAAALILLAFTGGLCAYAASETDAAQSAQTDTEQSTAESVAAIMDTMEDAAQQIAPETAEGEESAEQAAVTKAADTDKNSAVTVETGTGVRAISFDQLDSTVRNGNITVQANAETLQNVEQMDVDDLIDAYDMQKGALEQANAGMQELYNAVQYISFSEENPDAASGMALKGAVLTLISGNIMSNEMSIGSLKAQIDDLDDKGDEYFNTETIRHQMSYAEDAVVSGVETLYIAVATQKLSLANGQRSMAALDRTIAEMEKRYELGQISQLQLEQLKSQREAAASQLQSLSFAIDNLETDIGVQLGWAIGVQAQVQPLPEITAYQLRQMSYESDLQQAQDSSFSIWQAQKAVRDAQHDYSEASSMNSKHAVESAKLSLTESERSVTQSFRKIFNTVAEKNRLVNAALDAQVMEQKTYDAAQKKYDLGMISKNSLLSAQDTLDDAKAAVTSAQYELFSAYQQYAWAKRGVISAQ